MGSDPARGRASSLILAGADPGFVEWGGGAAATASATGATVFGGSRLKTLFGISKGGERAPPAPPPPNPLVTSMRKVSHCCGSGQ